MSKSLRVPGFGEVLAGSPADRSLGALLGLAVGDALGTTYEFEAIEQAPYPTLATTPATDVVGGGPFGLAAGQVTDDTQLACALATSLVTRRGFDPEDVANRYVAWREHALEICYQTSSALARRAEGETDAGRAVWHAGNRRPAGNGSLMRTAPLGVFYANASQAVVIDAAIAESLITHADPRCALACAVFDVAIAAAIAGATAMNDTARAALSPAANRLRATWRDDPDDVRAIDTAEADLQRDLDAAAGDDPCVYGAELDLHRTAGFVRVAFRLAFWHASHTASWRDALVDVASRGGDADTNAAIVGALLGARDGVLAIPDPWIERVLSVTQPGPPAWADAHHPRQLLALAR